MVAIVGLRLQQRTDRPSWCTPYQVTKLTLVVAVVATVDVDDLVAETA
jgi:hypothetical protein